MIYITGDCHGDFSRFEDNKFSNLTKDDYVIICGDFGGIWDNNKFSRHDRKNLKALSKMSFTTLFVDGNHENFNHIYKYPIIEWNGGKVHKISQSIYHLMRGEIYILDDKKIFVFGGAESHDIKDGILNETEIYKTEDFDEKHISFRIRNHNWWDLELPTKEELENGLANLEKNNYKVDYIITHCGPTSIQNEINDVYPINRLTEYFEELKKNISFKKWYFGHYHQNIKNIQKNFECIYDDIIEMK
jgi:predicted phosphodiesterase